MTIVADQLLKLSAVAQRLSIGVKTAQRRVYAGEIEWINVAPPGAKRASIRVAESALVAYEQRQRRAGVGR